MYFRNNFKFSVLENKRIHDTLYFYSRQCVCGTI